MLHMRRMSCGSIEKEISCVVNWFAQWSIMQKGDFLKDLVEKAVPDRVDVLFDTMKGLNMQDKPPSIFQCQMKLFNQWFSEWTDADVNNFMLQLRTIDPGFVAKFDEEVAAARANPDATTEELKQAFRRLAKQHHPDKQADGDISGESKEMFMRVHHAWRVLGNPELRKHYDSKWRSQETYQAFPVQEEVKLGEFMFDHDSKQHWHECRCGGSYVLSSQDVEVRVKYVCCDDCSLMVQVIYAEDGYPEILEL